MPARGEFGYDVALSFAGEQRAYVEKVAAALRRRGHRPFYDDYEKASLWGKDLYEHLDCVYQKACNVPKLPREACGLAFSAAQAIRRYSLITPPRTRCRWIGASSGMTVAGSWLGGRCPRPWCGLWSLKCRAYSSRTAAAWRSL